MLQETIYFTLLYIGERLNISTKQHRGCQWMWTPFCMRELREWGTRLPHYITWITRRKISKYLTFIHFYW